MALNNNDINLTAQGQEEEMMTGDSHPLTKQFNVQQSLAHLKKNL
jgi:hypothetical protein